eukprot:c20153_g2_i1 orf=308-511(-)
MKLLTIPPNQKKRNDRLKKKAQVCCKVQETFRRPKLSCMSRIRVTMRKLSPGLTTTHQQVLRHNNQL